MPDESPAEAQLAARLLAAMHGSWMAQAVHVTAELRLADLLAAGPRTSEDLAEATATHGPSLRRLLRALVTLELCREREDGAFEVTPLGRLLTTDGPGSLRSWAIWWGAHLWPVWGNLLYSVRSGRSARARLTGTAGFEHLVRDPATAALFNQAAAEMARLAADDIVRGYDFSGLRRIVDVGGGHGELLLAILERHPTATGVLFDLPHAIEGARPCLAASGVGERCTFAAGDFFAAVPGGGDAYVLKSVVHDWNDDDAARILDSVRRAMPDGARLLLVERVLPERWEASAAHQALAWSDLTMLVAHAARERTEADFRKLLEAADFDLMRTVPAGSTFSVLEGWPRPSRA